MAILGCHVSLEIVGLTKGLLINYHCLVIITLCLWGMALGGVPLDSHNFYLYSWWFNQFENIYLPKWIIPVVKLKKCKHR